MLHGEAIMRPPDGFLGFDKHIRIQQAAGPKMEIERDTVTERLLIIAHAFYFAEAINNAGTGLQIQVLQPRTELRGQTEWDIGTGTMRRMQIRDFRLDAHQIHFAEPDADIHIAGLQRGAVGNGGESTNENKFHFGYDEPLRS